MFLIKDQLYKFEFKLTKRSYGTLWDKNYFSKHVTSLFSNHLHRIGLQLIGANNLFHV